MSYQPGLKTQSHQEFSFDPQVVSKIMSFCAIASGLTYLGVEFGLDSRVAPNFAIMAAVFIYFRDRALQPWKVGLRDIVALLAFTIALTRALIVLFLMIG